MKINPTKRLGFGRLAAAHILGNILATLIVPFGTSALPLLRWVDKLLFYGQSGLNVLRGQTMAYASIITAPVLVSFIGSQLGSINSIASSGVKG